MNDQLRDLTCPYTALHADPRPRANGMAESYLKTFMREYVRAMLGSMHPVLNCLDLGSKTATARTRIAQIVEARFPGETAVSLRG